MTRRTSLNAASRALLAGLALSLVTACQPKTTPLTPAEAQTMNDMLKNKTPRCFGRFLVDLPESFVVNSEGAAELDGVQLKVRAMPRLVFDSALEARRRELEMTMLPGDDKNRPHLRTTIALPDGGIGVVFDRTERAVDSSRLGRTLELIAWRDGYRIDAFINATDTSFPEDAGDSIVKQLRTDVPEKLAQLLKVYQRTRGRADNEVPKEQGTCTQNGFVAGAPSDAESVAIFYHLKDTPDVYFSFKTDSSFRETTELLDRGKEINQALQGGDGKILRKGRVKGAGVEYQELLAEGRTPARVKGHLFVAEANSLEGSANRPVVMIDQKNGYRIPAPDPGPAADPLPEFQRATLTEAQAVAVWDSVLPSLRPRPGAF